MCKKIPIGKETYGAVWLAPMAGMSDAAFRRICKAHGADYMTTEMVSAKALCYGDKKTRTLARIRPDEMPCAVQLFGSEPETMAKASEILMEISAKNGINIHSVLEMIVNNVPAPTGDREAPLQCLIFDSQYDSYRGAIVYLRVMNGTVRPGMDIRMMATGAEYKVVEVGYLHPLGMRPAQALGAAIPPLSLTQNDDEGGGQMDISVDSHEEKIAELLSLRQVVCELEPRDRKIVVMRFFQSKTQTQTAEALGMTQVQVSRREKAILSTMRAKLTG